MAAEKKGSRREEGWGRSSWERGRREGNGTEGVGEKDGSRRQEKEEEKEKEMAIGDGKKEMGQ